MTCWGQSARSPAILSVRQSCGLLLTALTWATAGCAPVWHLHYDEAEKLARARQRPLAIFYKAPLDVRSSQLEDLLETPPARQWLADKVRCILTSDFPPFRRYVAQFGVLQAPALILIHPDGTYHARNAPADLDELLAFLQQAQPPGRTPELNPQIPRAIDYRWEGIYEQALAAARQQNRELFIVYKWWLSPESTELLNMLQTRPEVARHFNETVNCVLDMDYLPNRTHLQRYGVTEVPAVVLVHRDGTYHAHSGPMTAVEIVRFVTGAKPPGRVPRGGRP